MNNISNNARWLDNLLTGNPQSKAVPSRNSSEETVRLRKVGIADASLIGCVLENYGYILCRSGHIRLLGGKNGECMSLYELNGLDKGYSTLKDVMIVAVTSDGGLFAVNYGKHTGAKLGEMLFLPCGSLAWERFSIGYRGFVEWMLGVSKSELVESCWIKAGTNDSSLTRQDVLAKAKISVLRSIAGKEG